MTNNELNTAILSIKNQVLDCNKIYLDKMSIGSRTSTDRQREVLRAVDIYIFILNYHYAIALAGNTDETVITEDDILEIISESTKLLSTFQSSYYVS